MTYILSAVGRTALAQFHANQERINGAAEGSHVHGFTVTPTVQQKLETKIQESSDFLKLVNVVPVPELKGEKLGLGVTGPIASRTNTSANGSLGRQPVDPTALEARDYECFKTDSDTLTKYATIDTWAKFPDFQSRLRGSVVQQQALDRLMIGFNGTSAAATTDRVAHPLLQDVNKGWLQHIREDAPARYMAHGEKDNLKIYIDPEGAGDYRNLDALVEDMIQLLDPWAQADGRLRAIVSRGLLHDKYFPIIDSDNKPTEVLAGQTLIAQKRMGSLPAIAPPYMVGNSVLVGPPELLSIYYQEGSRRSRTIDNPKFDQIETYESSNDAYVVENYGYFAFAENIVFGPKP